MYTWCTSIKEKKEINCKNYKNYKLEKDEDFIRHVAI